MSVVGRRAWPYVGLMLLLGTGAAGSAAPTEKALSSEAKVIAGDWVYRSDTISIAGQPFDGYGTPPTVPPFATFDVRGWDWLQAAIGIRDGDYAQKCEVSLEVDGEQIWHKRLVQGEKAYSVSIPLTGRRSVTIRHDCDMNDSYPHTITIAEPKLIKGLAQGPPTPPSAPTPNPGPGGTVSAPFAVDPRDLDRLAADLRKKVDANESLKRRIENGQTAVATFDLIDVPSPPVARNVAEDLYTAMINSGFPLVERGQLDKWLKELKIQNMGLVDPKTAQRIGQLSGCDVILLGSISDRGQFVVINARLMDTATGKSLVADRVEMRKIAIQRGE